MSSPDLAEGIRGHRAFGRQPRSVAAYNAHMAEALDFACLVEDGRALIEPLGWALLMARGGDPGQEAQGDAPQDALMHRYLDAGWRRIAPGEEDFDILLAELLALCRRRRITLSARAVPAVFWLAPGAPEVAAAPVGPDRAAVLAAMARIAETGLPEALRAAGIWFALHPETGLAWPAEVIWATASGQPAAADDAPQARDALRRLGITVLGPDQPAAEIALLPAEIDRLPPGIDSAARQVTRTIHERDPAARRACERHYRALNGGRLLCEGCRLDFGATYGVRGEGFMHFHQLAAPAGADAVREVDGTRDLVPLCPNCHAMVHRGPDLLDIAGLRALLGPQAPAP